LSSSTFPSEHSRPLTAQPSCHRGAFKYVHAA
jgi:hypothetical protein